jgi:hypothetical protein
MVKAKKEDMGDGSKWYSCSQCNAMWENKKDANNCCLLENDKRRKG